jgi:hypothetical protein
MARMDADLPPWPRLADSWWVYLLGAFALVLYPIGLVERLRCGLGRCTGSAVERLFDLDGLGGLPRLFVTGLFVTVAVLAWLARRRCVDQPRSWWTAIAGIGALLAVAKLVSAHSAAKQSAPVLTLVIGVLITGVVLRALVSAGRRWAVPAARPVVVALAVYAAAALGLDAITSLLEASQDHVGVLWAGAATFVEELGEALAAIFVVVSVRWHLPPSPVGSSGVVQAPGQEFRQQ